MLKRGSLRSLAWYARYYTAPWRTSTVRQHDLTRTLSTEQAQIRIVYLVNHDTHHWTEKHSQNITGCPKFEPLTLF